MTKLEARNLMPSWMKAAQDSAQNRTSGSASDFGLRTSSLIRHSSFPAISLCNPAASDIHVALQAQEH
jgi:hypothetical protein